MDAAPKRESEGDGDRAASQKSPDAFRTISEVSVDLDVPQHVLRFWEGKFTQIRPLKRGGGRRYYRPEDVDLLRGIQHLLYGDGYTIKGVQKLLRENGVKHVVAAGRRDSAAAKTKPKPATVIDEAAAPVLSSPVLHGGSGGEADEGGAPPLPAAAQPLPPQESVPPTPPHNGSLGGAPYFGAIHTPAVHAASRPTFGLDAPAPAAPPIAPEAPAPDEDAESRRIEAAAKLLARLKALKRDFDTRLQAAKNGRS